MNVKYLLSIIVKPKQLVKILIKRMTSSVYVASDVIKDYSILIF